MRRPAGFLVGVLTASFVLTACGGGSGGSTTPTSASNAAKQLSATAWVATFCTYVKGIEDQIEARSNALATATPATLEEAKQSFVDFLSFTVDQFGTVETHMATFGTPDVSGGAKAIADLNTKLEQAKGVLQDALTKGQALSTDSSDAFNKGVDEIGAELDSAQPFGANDHLTFGQADLDAAYTANPTCQALENQPASP